MSKRYREIMDQIVVTEEMRHRILKKVQSPKRKMVSVYQDHIGKAVAAAACILILIGGIWIGMHWKQPDNSNVQVADQMTPSPTEEADVIAPSEIVTCKDLEALSKEMGYTVMEPKKLPFEPEQTEYTSQWGEFAQILYTKGKNSIMYRQSKEKGDVSGDFNTYQSEEEKQIGDWSVTLKGDGKHVSLAVWEDTAYSYSISFDMTISKKEAVKVIQSIQ